MKHEMLQLQLHAELQRFGLNPQEWSLKQVHSASYLIENKQDRSFSLLGTLKKTKTRLTWRSLELASI